MSWMKLNFSQSDGPERKYILSPNACMSFKEKMVKMTCFQRQQRAKSTVNLFGYGEREVDDWNSIKICNII